MKENKEYSYRFFLALCRIDEMYYALGKSMGVKENVLVLLSALEDGKPRTQKQICEEWLTPKTTINTGVKECVKAGYITYTAGEDGREKLLTLTKAGKEYVKKVLDPVKSIETAVFGEVLEQYSAEFIDAMELYAELMKKELDKKLAKAE